MKLSSFLVMCGGKGRRLSLSRRELIPSSWGMDGYMELMSMVIRSV